MPNKSKQRIPDEKLHLLITRGNYEAFLELKKRYHKHSLVLVNDLLTQYINTGISKKDLTSVCDGHFAYVVRNYLTGRSSFYSYWKEITSQSAMDYLIDNSYGGEASIFNGSISLNQQGENSHDFDDILSEKDIDKNERRKIFEIKAILARNDASFTTSEKAVLNLLLTGITFKEIEKTGLYGKTYIHLTYKSAIEKLKKFAKEPPKNKK